MGEEGREHSGYWKQKWEKTEEYNKQLTKRIMELQAKVISLQEVAFR